MSHHTAGRISPCRPALSASRRAALSRVAFGVFTLGVPLALLQTPASAQMTAQTYAVARGAYGLTEQHDNKNALDVAPKLETKAAVQPPAAVGQSAMTLFPTSMGANAHGCAGGNDLTPNFVSGQGGSTGQVQEVLHLTSATLPIGTPVDVTFQYFAFIAPEREEGIVYDIDGVVISADVSVNVRGVVAAGSYYYDSPEPGGQAHTPRTSGLFGGKQDATVIVKNVLVGEYFRLSADLSVYAFGAAGLETYNAADIRAGIQWSGSAADCSIFIDDTGAPFPAISDAPPSNWGSVIPPFQLPTGIGGGAAPEPGSLALLGIGFSVWGIGVIRRKAH